MRKLVSRPGVIRFLLNSNFILTVVHRTRSYFEKFKKKRFHYLREIVFKKQHYKDIPCEKNNFRRTFKFII